MELLIEDSLNVFYLIYSKEYAKKMKVKKEVQEYSKQATTKSAFIDKLEDDDKTKLLHLV
jgi:hypothetical protein